MAGYLTGLRGLARRTVLAQVEQFTLADLAAQLPTTSPQLIKKVLAELKKTGKVRLAGKGRGARWITQNLGRLDQSRRTAML